MTETQEQGVQAEIEASAGIAFFASIRAKLSSLFRRSVGEERSRNVPAKSAALRGLRAKKLPLVIDDFHYLSREHQKSLLRALKPLVFDRLAVVLIAIPHRKLDVLKSERELVGRVEQIEIPPWEPDELFTIATTGFPLLNVQVPEAELDSLTDQAYGSPHLMQEFCASICEANHVEQTQPTPLVLSLKGSSVDKLLTDVAETTGRPVYDKLRRGPRSRKDRIIRELIDGQQTDIYGVVLRALAEIMPSVESLHIQQIRDSVRAVTKTAPHLHRKSREYLIICPGFPSTTMRHPP